MISPTWQFVAKYHLSINYPHFDDLQSSRVIHFWKRNLLQQHHFMERLRLWRFAKWLDNLWACKLQQFSQHPNLNDHIFHSLEKSSTFRWLVCNTYHPLLESDLTWHWHTVNAHIAKYLLDLDNIQSTTYLFLQRCHWGYPNTILCATSKDCQYSSGTKDVEHSSAFRTRKTMRLPNMRPHPLITLLCSCWWFSCSPSLSGSLLFSCCGELLSCISKESLVLAPVVQWSAFLCI